jgi:hypothetical protein
VGPGHKALLALDLYHQPGPVEGGDQAVHGGGLLVKLAEAAPEQRLLRAAHGQVELARPGVLAQDDKLAGVAGGDDFLGLVVKRREREREIRRGRMRNVCVCGWMDGKITLARFLFFSLLPFSLLTLSTLARDSSDAAQKAGVFVLPRSMYTPRRSMLMGRGRAVRRDGDGWDDERVGFDRRAAAGLRARELGGSRAGAASEMGHAHTPRSSRQPPCCARALNSRTRRGDGRQARRPRRGKTPQPPNTNRCG